MADVWSLAQQQDEAFSEAWFEEFSNKQGWYCALGKEFPRIIGVGETKKQAFNHAWGKKMGAFKNQITMEMEDTGMDIEEVLERRGNRYGEYRDVAYTSQTIKALIEESPSWKHMEAYMQESLEMIANKLSRILNGDPYYDDSWRDIAGYATLVVKELEKGK